MSQPAESLESDALTDAVTDDRGGVEASSTSAGGNDYVARLRDEVEQRSATEGSSAIGTPYIEQAFTLWAAELLEEKGYIAGFDLDSWQFAPPGGQLEMKLNAFHLDAAEGRALIVVTEWDGTASSANKMPKRQLEDLLGLGESFLEKTLLHTPPLHQTLEPSRSHAQFAAEL